MLDDVNRSIEALLKSELPAGIARQTSISFATPDESFPPSGLILPAINLFLYEIRENFQLREVECSFERQPDGRLIKVAPPVRIDCRYLVTAVATQQQGSERDEHQLLGATLKALLRHRILPAAVLKGELASSSPPVRCATSQSAGHPTGIELWQSLKARPRASLHYTLTVPVEVMLPVDAAPAVLTLSVGGS